MPDHRLVFTSKALMMGLLEHDEPASVTFEGWTFTELYEPDAHAEVRPGLGRYRLELSRAVSSIDEFWRLEPEGIHLLEDLQRVWAYAWGTPMHSSGFGVFLSIVRAPDGWLSNGDQLCEDLQRERGGLIVGGRGTSTSRHWRYAPQFPLRRALQALRWYRDTSEDNAVRELIQLHYRAHVVNDPDGPALILAKALDIVRELLPGETDAKKQTALPAGVEGLLAYPLHELFNLANNRRETRHPVVQGEAALHPPLAGEGLGFLKSADLVVNAVASERLGLDPWLPLQGEAPQAAGSSGSLRPDLKP
jgi:hypothetical protein